MIMHSSRLHICVTIFSVLVGVRSEEHSAGNLTDPPQIPFLTDPVSVKIFLGENKKITVIDTSKSKPINYLNHTTSIQFDSVDYHYLKRMIFFTTMDKIYRDDYVGRLLRVGQPKAIVDVGTDGRVSLAVDWVHDRLYWMSVRHQTVEVADLDGSNRTLLFDNLGTIRFPNNIAVDPYAGHLFLVANYSVFRADLDGANLARLQPYTRGVKSFTLNTCKRRVYFVGKEGYVEDGEPYIASCDYKGRNGQKHPLPVPKEWNDIFAVDVFRDTLYFAHYIPLKPDTLYETSMDLKILEPARKYNGGCNPYLAPEGCLLRSMKPLYHKFFRSSQSIWSLRIYHPDVQKQNLCQRHNEKQDGDA